VVPTRLWRKWSSLLLLLLFVLAPVAGGAGEAPFQVESREERSRLEAQISSIIDFPYDQVGSALTTPESWCDFLPLIFNIKACTFDDKRDPTLLTLFVARRFHDPPAQAIRMQYDFEVKENGPDHSHIRLLARRGPHSTRDYVVDVEIRPADDGQTELHLHSYFRTSFRSRLATRAYLRGAGRDKVGFSIERYQRGRPVYTSGVRGIIERNAMRHFLALEAFLATRHLPEEERLEASLHAWFEATEEYPEQLYEMEKEEYLVAKRRERQRQEQMQERVETARRDP
jgi:hypothetical protein